MTTVHHAKRSGKHGLTSRWIALSKKGTSVDTELIECLTCGDWQENFWCNDCMTKWINEQASK